MRIMSLGFWDRQAVRVSLRDEHVTDEVNDLE